LSSQTTDTPGTTTTIRSRIAPEQLFKLTRVRNTLQISVSATHKPSDPPHPNPERTKRRPDPVLKFRGLAASGSQLLAGLPLGDLENNTPTQAPPQLHPRPRPHAPAPPEIRGKTGHRTPKWRLGTTTPNYAVHHHNPSAAQPTPQPRRSRNETNEQPNNPTAADPRHHPSAPQGTTRRRRRSTPQPDIRPFTPPPAPATGALNTKRAGNQTVAGPPSSHWLQDY
jgi:hypothetical protein